MDRGAPILSHEEEFRRLENAIKSISDGETPLQILEAGSGQFWPLDLSGIDYHLTGVDLDRQAMEIRMQDRKDLDEAIVMDLRDMDFGDRKFDVIYNSYVLEHIEGTERVMQNFDRALRPGGLIVLRMPDRNTVFGFIARVSPFWVHIAYKRYIEGLKDAGKPGHPPYRTYHEKMVSRQGIEAFCDEYNYSVEFASLGAEYLRFNTLKIKLLGLFARTVSLLSLGRLPWRHNNLTYVLQKKGD